MFCTKCGAQASDNAKFCPKCGAELGKNKKIVQNQANIGKESDKQEKVRKAGKDKQNEPGGKKGSIKWMIALVITLFLVLGIGAGGAYYYFGSYSNEKSFEGRGGDKEKDDDIKGSKKDTEEKEEGDTTESGDEDGQDEPQKFEGERTPVDINIHQVDNSNFPEITFYASITDENDTVIDGLETSDFVVQEISSSGQIVDVELSDVYKVLNEDTISVNLVLDASGSMDDYNKMQQAKNAAKSLIDQMQLGKGDQAEVIAFDTYVYLAQDFTRDSNALKNSIDSIVTGNMTALFDAIYAGLYQTHFESGVKCVIAFTDGMENSSSYTYDDIVALSQNTSIPVFIIGIGADYDADVLQALATDCSGAYYSADVNNLEEILSDIYLSIYQEQQDYYVFKYTTPNQDNLTQFRDISLKTSETTEFVGSYTKEYTPQSDISGAFSDRYMNRDYMLDFSGDREVTNDDLQGMSLAELRIARNEIFARHGRQFKDSMLNQWFYSKSWYLNIPAKYAPDEFDGIRPSPLSKIEIKNTETIRQYEQNMMDNYDIYPDAANLLLTDYDLALSKPVLKRALAQVQGYPNTDILQQNIQAIQNAINTEDVVY